MNVIQLFFEALKKVMPDVMDRINPPATETQIQQLKSVCDCEIDPLYIDFLNVCNGEKDILFMGMGALMIDVERSINYHTTEWMDWHSIADNPEKCKSQYYSRKRVCIMEDGGGSAWFLDYDPASEGKMGQVICIFRDQPETVFNCYNSFEDLLKAAIFELENGRVTIDEDYKSFNYLVNHNDLYNFYAGLSALQSQITVKTPHDLFKNLSEDWFKAICAGQHNFVPRKDNIALLDDPKFALHVREIRITTPEMMRDFAVLKHFPKLQFLEIHCPEIPLEDKHFDVMCAFRLTEFGTSNPIKNLARLADIKTLQKVVLKNTQASIVQDLCLSTGLRDIYLMLDTPFPNVTFLQKMAHLETLFLCYNSPKILSEEEAKAIAAVPKLQSFAATNISVASTQLIKDKRTILVNLF